MLSVAKLLLFASGLNRPHEAAETARSALTSVVNN